MRSEIDAVNESRTNIANRNVKSPYLCQHFFCLAFSHSFLPLVKAVVSVSSVSVSVWVDCSTGELLSLTGQMIE